MSESLLDRLRAEFQSRKRRVTVLGVEVYVTPLTIAEETMLATKFPNDSARRWAETFILKCRDADGKPVFSKDDGIALKNEVAGDALQPLIAALVGLTPADAEKNS